MAGKAILHLLSAETINQPSASERWASQQRAATNCCLWDNLLVVLSNSFGMHSTMIASIIGMSLVLFGFRSCCCTELFSQSCVGSHIIHGTKTCTWIITAIISLHGNVKPWVAYVSHVKELKTFLKRYQPCEINLGLASKWPWVIDWLARSFISRITSFS